MTPREETKLLTKAPNQDGPPINDASSSFISEGSSEQTEAEDEARILTSKIDAGSKTDLEAKLNEKTTPWTSIIVAGICGFIMSFQFSLFFASLWPYLQILDVAATETFFGLIVGVYSLAQMITSPAFGYWSNRIRKVQTPLHAGFTCMIVGNIVYLGLEFLPAYQRFGMLFCRFVVGAGSGNMSLLRAYASTASVAKDRARAITFITGPIALGMTFGPAFQLLFTSIGYPGWQVFGSFHLTMYNAPALFAIVMNIAGMLVLHCFFEEVYSGIVEKDMKTGKTGLPPYDKVAIIICNVTRFTQMCITANLETIGSSLAMMLFAWTRAESVRYISISQIFFGAICFANYLFYIVFKFGKNMNFRITTMVSLVLMALFHIVTFSWWFIPGNVVVTGNRAQDNSTAEEQVGCDASRFSWCSALSPVNPWLYYTVRAICIGIAFPTINITMTTLYSRIIGPRRQGTLQGYFQMSGSAAKLVGPVLISFIYMTMGPRWVWAVQIALLGVTFILWVVFYKRMVPLKITQREKKDRKINL